MEDGAFSPAARAPGTDGRRDDPEDLRRDEISAFQYAPADLSDVALVEEPVDEWDAADVRAQRKFSEVWSMSKKRVAQRRAAMQQERPSLTTLRTDALLLRNAAIPDAVWTLGDSRHGQCGHPEGTSSSDTPHPASLELQTLRDGIRGLYAGPYCTVVVTQTGQALGFGSGPFRSAVDATTNEAPSRLGEASSRSAYSYEGAPPFRVARPVGLDEAILSGEGSGHGGGGGGQVGGCSSCGCAASGSALAAARAWAAAESVGEEPETAVVLADHGAHGPAPRHPRGSRLGDAVAGGASALAMAAAAHSFERTEEAVLAGVRRRAREWSNPTALGVLNVMPVHQLAMGEDFCIALMGNGMVMAWGDGEEVAGLDCT